MDCPSCETTLQSATYEELRVFQCPDCSGVLLNLNRLPQIKAARGLSTEELQEQAESVGDDDTHKKIDCPRCRAVPMDKLKSRQLEPSAELFMIDVCKPCRLAWFNGGELARLQLAYESTPKALAELQMQLEAESRTEEEEAELQENLARLSANTGDGGGIPCLSCSFMSGFFFVLAAAIYFLYHFFFS